MVNNSSYRLEDSSPQDASHNNESQNQNTIDSALFNEFTDYLTGELCEHMVKNCPILAKDIVSAGSSRVEINGNNSVISENDSLKKMMKEIKADNTFIVEFVMELLMEFLETHDLDESDLQFVGDNADGNKSGKKPVLLETTCELLNEMEEDRKTNKNRSIIDSSIRSANNNAQQNNSNAQQNNSVKSNSVKSDNSQMKQNNTIPADSMKESIRGDSVKAPSIKYLSDEFTMDNLRDIAYWLYQNYNELFVVEEDEEDSNNQSVTSTCEAKKKLLLKSVRRAITNRLIKHSFNLANVLLDFGKLVYCELVEKTDCPREQGRIDEFLFDLVDEMFLSFFKNVNPASIDVYVEIWRETRVKIAAQASILDMTKSVLRGKKDVKKSNKKNSNSKTTTTTKTYTEEEEVITETTETTTKKTHFYSKEELKARLVEKYKKSKSSDELVNHEDSDAEDEEVIHIPSKLVEERGGEVAFSVRKSHEFFTEHKSMEIPQSNGDGLLQDSVAGSKKHSVISASSFRGSEISRGSKISKGSKNSNKGRYAVGAKVAESTVSANSTIMDDTFINTQRSINSVGTTSSGMVLMKGNMSAKLDEHYASQIRSIKSVPAEEDNNMQNESIKSSKKGSIDRGMNESIKSSKKGSKIASVDMGMMMNESIKSSKKGSKIGSITESIKSEKSEKKNKFERDGTVVDDRMFLSV